MITYEGMFGQHYRVNKHGVVCVRLKGEHSWRHSNYTLEHFKVRHPPGGSVKQSKVSGGLIWTL